MSSRRNTDPNHDDAELYALLQLRMLPALADDRLKLLLARSTAKSIVANATRADLGDRAFDALHSRQISDRADRAMRMIEDLQVQVFTCTGAGYPPQLHHLSEFAPPVLFCRGDVTLFEKRALGVVGARDSTEYGDSVADMLAGELARRGVVIISGLARGIDAIAHRAALANNGGTIAVLGCGIDVHYPPQNARLQERIAEEGLLVSEFAPGTGALRHHFPQRNRLIAMLGSGVIVVEAGPKSGTRKTVDWAIHYNVPVFAVPGPIGRYESQGTNEIIQDGGALITGVRDIIEMLRWNDAVVSESSRDDVLSDATFDAAARRVYAAVPATGTHVDDIARRAQCSSSEALTLLMQLELYGVVVQQAGMRYARVMKKPARTVPCTQDHLRGTR